jgi:hypothetical protein
VSDPTTTPITVDGFHRGWAPDEISTLGMWAQGHLLVGPPLSWAEYAEPDGAASSDQSQEAGTSRSDADLAVPGAWQVSQSEDTFRWAAITSQTCDVGGEGPGARHPFVQVSPVVSLEGYSPTVVDAIRNHRKVDMVLLTQPPTAGGWAVDLRVNLPVAKEVLLTAAPIQGFATEEDLLRFAEHLSLKSNRAALHPSLSEELPKSIKEHVKTQRKSQPEWWQKVEQLRVHVIAGTRLEPLKVRLVVIEYSTLEAAEREVWREWAKAFGKQLQTQCRATMLMPLFSSLDALSARLFVESVPLDDSVLSR